MYLIRRFALMVVFTVGAFQSIATVAEDQWLTVVKPRPLVFPADHGPHRDYRIEWWYYTGNLVTAAGRRFGYQLTFFRTGMRRQPTNPSRWTVDDLYVAHFALADVERGKFYRFERTSRGGIGWSGADENGRHIWNGVWDLTMDADQHRLSARQDRCELQLSLHAAKPPISHGDQGLSRKGAQPGNASYYYSLTRLATQGQLSIEGETYDVRGDSWMDHEFSSSFLEKGQQGWDWFSLQFDGDRELMLYQIRGPGGAADPQSSGTFVLQDGTTRLLQAGDFQLIPQDKWRSPASHGEYPLKWLVRIPSLAAELVVAATFPGQEMDTRVSTGIVYWEGTVDATGRLAGAAVRGQGYLEMTGYVTGNITGLFE